MKVKHLLSTALLVTALSSSVSVNAQTAGRYLAYRNARNEQRQSTSKDWGAFWRNFFYGSNDRIMLAQRYAREVGSE